MYNLYAFYLFTAPFIGVLFFYNLVQLLKKIRNNENSTLNTIIGCILFGYFVLGIFAAFGLYVR